MTRNHLQLAELIATAALGLALLLLAAFLAYLDRMGEAFGAVIATIPVVITAMGRIGQSKAMSQMADALANSQPIGAQATGKADDPVHVEEETR